MGLAISSVNAGITLSTYGECSWSCPALYIVVWFGSGNFLSCSMKELGEKQSLSTELKERDLSLQGKTMEQLTTFLIDHLGMDVAEVDEYIHTLGKKEWTRLIALLRGDKPVAVSFDPMWHDFSHFRCPAWSQRDADPLKLSFLMYSYPEFKYLKVLRVHTTRSVLPMLTWSWPTSRNASAPRTPK